MATETDSRLSKLRSQAAVLFDESAADRESDLSPWQRFLRFWVFVGRSFNRNRCPVRAAALAYTTLLALIPMLAVVISISTALLKTEGGSAEVTKLVNDAIDKFAPQLGLKTEGIEDNREKLSGVITSSIAQVQSGALGATAALVLIFVAISLLANIENTLNDIWGVPRGRTWFSRVIYYWAVLTLVPILVLFALGLKASPYFAKIQAAIQHEEKAVVATNTAQTVEIEATEPKERAKLRIADGIRTGKILPGEEVLWTKKFETNFDAAAKELGSAEVKVRKKSFAEQVVTSLVPVVVLSFTFGWFYFLMPNTKVEWRAAVIGGLLTGLLLQINTSLNQIYFGQVVRNSKLWGGLGTVPVFLIGLYFSWLILLLGAQVAYAFQNRRAYFQEKQADNIHQRGREFVALRLMTCIARCFEKGERAPTANELADALFIPSRLVGKISEPLLTRQLLIEVAAVKNGEVGFAPGRPLEKISCEDIIDAMRSAIGEDVPTKADEMRGGVTETFEKIYGGERKVAGNITLREMIQNGSPSSS